MRLPQCRDISILENEELRFRYPNKTSTVSIASLSQLRLSYLVVENKNHQLAVEKEKASEARPAARYLVGPGYYSTPLPLTPAFPGRYSCQESLSSRMVVIHHLSSSSLLKNHLRPNR